MLRHTWLRLILRRQAGASRLRGAPRAPVPREPSRGPLAAPQQQQPLRASIRGFASSIPGVHAPDSAAAPATAEAAATTAAARGGALRGPQGPVWGFIRREEPSQAVEAFLMGDRGESSKP